MSKTFWRVTRMCPNIWNAHRIQSEFLECTSIVKECTTNFHSNGILALMWLPLKGDPCCWSQQWTMW